MRKTGKPKAAPLWPARVLTFDTETTTDAVQRLIFGSYRASRWVSATSLELVQEGLFYADDLADWNPSALRELRDYADLNAIRLISRREFMERVFRPLAVDAEALVVGFNLPFDISRIAIEAGEARAPNYGGFSSTLWDYEAAAGKWKEHPFRPRIAVKSLDSKRAFSPAYFSRLLASGERETVFGTDQTVRVSPFDFRCQCEPSSRRRRETLPPKFPVFGSSCRMGIRSVD